MKKYIFVIDYLRIIVLLLSGKSVEGRLYIDKQTHVLTFKAWERKAPKNPPHRKICELDGGWLGESDLHIVRHEKFPKSLGLMSILRLIRRDNLQTEEALVDRDIIDHV